MKRNEPSDLLRDVLIEGEMANFERALMETTLRSARRRKVVRRLGSGAGIMLAVVATWLTLHTFVGPVHPKPDSAVAVVHSAPLRPDMLATQQGPVPLAASSSFTIASVRSEEGGFEVLGDADLLSFLRGHPAALVQRGQGKVELVFVNPEDMDGFPVRRFVRQ